MVSLRRPAGRLRHHPGLLDWAPDPRTAAHLRRVRHVPGQPRPGDMVAGTQPPPRPAHLVALRRRQARPGREPAASGVFRPSGASSHPPLRPQCSRKTAMIELGTTNKTEFLRAAWGAALSRASGVAGGGHEPSRSGCRSRLALVVHQGSDPTLPYEALVIRESATLFGGFTPWGL